MIFNLFQQTSRHGDSRGFLGIQCVGCKLAYRLSNGWIAGEHWTMGNRDAFIEHMEAHRHNGDEITPYYDNLLKGWGKRGGFFLPQVTVDKIRKNYNDRHGN